MTITIQFILGLSILVQAAAGVLAVRLNWRYGRRWAWTIISAAIVLMTVRRCVTFVRTLNDEAIGNTAWLDESSPLLMSAVISLVVSGLLLVGVALINPIFRQIRQAESVLADENRRLEEIVTVNEAEFRLARQVQQQLYPDQDPKVEGLDISGRSIPARSASGDYFDYLRLADGALAVVVGDASGHGMGAALMMTETRTFLHALSKSHSDPAEILSLTNQFLREHTNGAQFVTLLLAKIDPKARTLNCAAAGHPAYLLHGSGDVELLEDDNLPLAVDNATYQCQSPRVFAPGDLLLICTDGFWEAEGPDDSMFGIDRVLELVASRRDQPARQIIASLFDSLHKFIKPRIHNDDITAVVIKA